jgi:PIN domain nuclease of toxin-antitoxin system
MKYLLDTHIFLWWITDNTKLNSISILNITMEHSLEIYDLPEIHKDPFDRMLIAQARVEKLTILTTDSFIKRYEVKTLF